MNIPKISVGAWVRTIVLIVTLINGALAMFGKQLLPINEDTINNVVNTGYALFSAIALIVASLVAWWRNNDFTKKARIRKEQIKRQSK